MSTHAIAKCSSHFSNCAFHCHPTSFFSVSKTSISFCLWYFISMCLSQRFISVLFSWISDMELLPFFTSSHFILPILLFLYSLPYSSSQLFFSFSLLPFFLLLSSLSSSFSYFMDLFLSWLFLSWPISFLFPLTPQQDISHLCFLFFLHPHLFDFIPIEISSNVPKWRGTHKEMVENCITEKGKKGKLWNRKIWWFTGKDGPFGG